MFNKKIKNLLTCITVAFVLVLVGCNDNSVESKNTSDDSNEEVTLRVLIWGNGPEEVKGEREIYDEFEKDHSNIKVELIHVPYDNQHEKFLTMSSGGDQPDLVWPQPAPFAEYVEKGLIKPLDELIERDGLNKDDWLPDALDYGTYQGKIYGLPRDVVTKHIAFNKDMFDEANVPYPNDGWTWDDFLETAKKLTVEKDGRIIQYGVAGYEWLEAVYANGGRRFGEDGKVVTIDSPEAIEAIQWVADLSNVHHVAPTPSESQGLGDLFLAEMAAMTITGPWNWRAYTVEGGFNWDIVETPGGKAGNKSELVGLAIAIGSETKHPEEAWTLLKWLGHGGGQDIQSDKIGAYPSVKRATDNFSQGEFAPENVDRLHKAMIENTVVPPYFIEFAEADSMLQPVIDQIMSGDVQAEEIIPEVAEKIRSELGLD